MSRDIAAGARLYLPRIHCTQAELPLTLFHPPTQGKHC